MFHVGSAFQVSNLPSWVDGDTFPTRVAGNTPVNCTNSCHICFLSFVFPTKSLASGVWLPKCWTEVVAVSV